MMSQAGEQHFVAVGTHRLAYTRAGSGPSIVLLHGIPTNAYLWRQIRPLLLAAGFEVVTFDLLGYGASDKPADADLGIAAQARMIGEALTTLGWQGGTLVGHDIGGGVAQLVAIDNRDRVTGLVLVDSIVYDSFPEPGIARLKEPAWDGILGAPDFDLKRGLSKGFARGLVHADRITPEMIDAYEAPFRGIEGRLSYLRAARALRTEELTSRTGDIETLQTPTLIVWGAQDVFQPIDYGRRLAGAMPHARFEAIEEAGHFLPEDAPEHLAQLIIAFQRERGAAQGE